MPSRQAVNDYNARRIHERVRFMRRHRRRSVGFIRRYVAVRRVRAAAYAACRLRRGRVFGGIVNRYARSRRMRSVRSAASGTRRNFFNKR